MLVIAVIDCLGRDGLTSSSCVAKLQEVTKLLDKLKSDLKEKNLFPPRQLPTWMFALVSRLLGALMDVDDRAERHPRAP